MGRTLWKKKEEGQKVEIRLQPESVMFIQEAGASFCTQGGASESLFGFLKLR